MYRNYCDFPRIWSVSVPRCALASTLQTGYNSWGLEDTVAKIHTLSAIAVKNAKPDITLRIYAHLFRNDDSKAAAAINAAFR